MFADKNIADWIYNKGSEDNIVLYSKVSIYRNLENIRFHYHMDKDEIDKVDSILKKNIEELNLNLTEIKLKNIDFSNINILKENLTLPKNRNLLNATLYTNMDESTSILVNSNEHCEIQTIARGFELKECFKKAYDIENKLDEKVDFSFDKKLGYLTGSPQKIGTAMNLTVSMAIPAILCKTPNNIDYFISKFSKLGFDLFLRDEKNIPIFNITNRVMIGIKEKDILKNMIEIVNDILDKEKKIRNRIKKLDKIKIEDRIYRSKAILSSARKLTYSEIIKYSFWLRAGLYYDMPEIKNIELDDLYYILFITKNNHLKNLNNQNNTQNINEIRANIIREIFNNK